MCWAIPNLVCLWSLWFYWILTFQPSLEMVALSIYLSLCILCGWLRNFSASAAAPTEYSSPCCCAAALSDNDKESWSISRWLKGSDVSLALPQAISLPKSTLLFCQIPGNLSSSESCGNCCCCCCCWYFCMLLLIGFSECFVAGQFFRSYHAKGEHRSESSVECCWRCICPEAKRIALCCMPLFSLFVKSSDAS